MHTDTKENEKPEKCYSCGGKGTYSQIHGVYGAEDFGGDGFDEKPSIHNYPCSACNGTGFKPQQEGEKLEWQGGTKKSPTCICNTNSHLECKDDGCRCWWHNSSSSPVQREDERMEIDRKHMEYTKLFYEKGLVEGVESLISHAKQEVFNNLITLAISRGHKGYEENISRETIEMVASEMGVKLSTTSDTKPCEHQYKKKKHDCTLCGEYDGYSRACGSEWCACNN